MKITVRFIVGQYQCFAENEHGVATSNSVFLRKAELNSFKDETPTTISAKEGDPFKLGCKPPDGWPKPNVYWVLQVGVPQRKVFGPIRP